LVKAVRKPTSELMRDGYADRGAAQNGMELQVLALPETIVSKNLSESLRLGDFDGVYPL
jgi:hypothetical protein